MIADRDLLKLAAKAAGIRLHVWGAKGAENFADLDAPETGGRWNPLTDDGDALRLAVKLHLMVDVDAIGEPISRVIATGIFENELHGADPCAATRRAIVRAAASIGAQAMSSFCNFMDCHDWTPEQRIAVALVETLRMKRNEDEQARAARFYERHFSTVTHSGQAPSRPADTAVRGDHFNKEFA